MIQTERRVSDSRERSQEPALLPVRTSRVGEIVADRYRVVTRLGAGGMGEVYQAEHLLLGRRFAIKFLRADSASDPRIVARFTREARAMALLESEHVVSIVDFGEHLDGVPFLVMELMRGEDLRQLLARLGPLPVARAIDILLDACAGLRVVHRAGLVHRDLKPPNLFVTKRDNGGDLCKVLDFGVVKSIVTDSTHHGSLVGTLRYMAPEQLQEAEKVDARTDIYALGAILYECLAGHAPHTGDTIERVIFKIMNELPRPLDELRHGLPAGLSAAVTKALARDVTARFESVEQFAAALSRFGRRPRAARDVAVNTGNDITSMELSLPVQPRRARLRVAARICVAAIVVIGVVVVGLVRQAGRRVAPNIASHPISGATLSPVNPPSLPLAVPAATTALPANLALASAATSATLAPTKRMQRAVRTPAASTYRSSLTPSPLLPGIDPQNPYGE
jgi:eukaryotic-like serine/threonine-protein kinase